MELIDEARQLTRDMRSGVLPAWLQLRDRLVSEGISPSDTAIGAIFFDDPGVEFGLGATRDGRFFYFTLEGSSEPRTEAATLWQWEEVEKDRYPDFFALALTVLEEEKLDSSN